MVEANVGLRFEVQKEKYVWYSGLNCTYLTYRGRPKQFPLFCFVLHLKAMEEGKETRGIND